MGPPGGASHREAVEQVVGFLELEPVRGHIEGEVGYGLRKRVDLARALAMESDVLLMDEPMAGMNVEEKEDIARFIIDVREARHIGSSSSSTTCTWSWTSPIGSPSWTPATTSRRHTEEVQNNEAVIASYLGGSS